MPASTHVDELFSAALDDELTPAQEQRFHDHLDECSDCAASYRTFTQAVGQVRSLPRAAMPLPVHLPSAAPTAERKTAAGWLRGLVPRSLPMGAATGVAALAAVAIVAVGLTRGSTPAPVTETPSTLSRPAGGASANGGVQASCPMAAPSGTTTAYANRATASDRSRPGQQLVVSASDLSVSPGGQIQLSAVLTVPGQAAGQRGAAPAVAPTVIAACLSITGVPTALSAPANNDAVAPPQIPVGSAHSALNGQTLSIPPGIAPGTVIHVVATVPANYPGSAEAPLTATLDITVR